MVQVLEEGAAAATAIHCHIEAEIVLSDLTVRFYGRLAERRANAISDGTHRSGEDQQRLALRRQACYTTIAQEEPPPRLCLQAVHLLTDRWLGYA